MNGLQEAFRHNSWATKELLSACRNLSEDQLSASAPGAYGDILATFNHLARAEAGYARRLTGRTVAWLDRDGDETVDIETLEGRIDELAPIWEDFTSRPVDAEPIIILNQGAYEAHAGVLVAQVLNHGNAHREQICAILTAANIQPPDIQAWAYGEATGRGRSRSPDQDG